MDERDVRDKRHLRGRAFVAAAVVVLVGSVIAIVASMSHTSTPSRTASTTSTAVPGGLGSVDVGEIGSITFLDADDGYGVESARYLVHSADGGRTWARVGLVPAGDRYVMLAPEYAEARNGLVAWGDGSLSQSSDGGAHWHATLGPSVHAVGEASLRLWATVVCDRGSPSPCTPRLATSVDAGRTWQEPATPAPIAAPGAPALSMPSGNTVYLVGQQFAWTPDGGRSWAHHAIPAACGERGVPYLADEAGTLLLVCSPGAQSGAVGTRAFVSVDEGHTWQATAPLPAQDTIHASAVSGADGGFVVVTDTGPLLVTTDDGHSWHPAFAVARGEGVRGISRAFGVGVWAAAGDAGIWFSADGVRWEQRARGQGAHG